VGNIIFKDCQKPGFGRKFQIIIVGDDDAGAYVFGYKDVPGVYSCKKIKIVNKDPDIEYWDITVDPGFDVVDFTVQVSPDGDWGEKFNGWGQATWKISPNLTGTQAEKIIRKISPIAARRFDTQSQPPSAMVNQQSTFVILHKKSSGPLLSALRVYR
jgi:hypothetical protein